MSDNRMKYTIESNMQFPLVEIALEAGESAFIQAGSMVYHSPSVTLNTKLNGRGSGLGKLLGAVGRSMVSGESMFITQAVSSANDGVLALDGSAQYRMERQSVGRAFFGGQGGLFVMTTEGQGTLLVNAFGSIKKIELNNQEITIDNAHVVAWSRDLDYDIHLENGFFQSIGTGEGVVNTFRGTGEIYVQSLNLQTFASQLQSYIVTSSN